MNLALDQESLCAQHIEALSQFLTDILARIYLLEEELEKMKEAEKRRNRFDQ